MQIQSVKHKVIFFFQTEQKKDIITIFSNLQKMTFK